VQIATGAKSFKRDVCMAEMSVPNGYGGSTTKICGGKIVSSFCFFSFVHLMDFAVELALILLLSWDFCQTKYTPQPECPNLHVGQNEPQPSAVGFQVYDVNQQGDVKIVALCFCSVSCVLIMLVYVLVCRKPCMM
jgi:hypothetical protein